MPPRPHRYDPAMTDDATPPESATPLLQRPPVRLGLVAVAILAGFGVALVPFETPIPPAAARLLGVTVAMAILWFTEALPLAVTSLVPLVAYPLLGILPSKPTAAEYINTYTFLFFGGLVIAAALERWNLHRRIALAVMRRVGTSPIGLCVGLMAVSAGLSMWISNTATAMLLLPIGLALIATLEEQIGRDDRLAVGLLLAIAYGANCGGMATPVGTPTNVTLLNEWSKQPSLADRPAPSLIEWLLMAGPFVLAMLAVLTLYFAIRMRTVRRAELPEGFFADRLRELGPMTGAGRTVLAIFLLTAGLWITRKPLEIGELTLSPGWEQPLESGLRAIGYDVPDGSVNDTVVATLAVLLLFAIPGRADGRWHTLLDWNAVERRLPWGVLLLFGAGFAIAAAFRATGLDVWCGQTVAAMLGDAGPLATTGGVVLLVTSLTEFTTNVGTLNTLLPVVASLAVELEIDPPRLMIPATLAASCAFMLPIATPPNAIVFGSGRIGLTQMAAAGLLLNLTAIGILTVMSSFLFR